MDKTNKFVIKTIEAFEKTALKEMRNSMIWIPFVILAVGIVLTIILVMNVKKTKPARLDATKKELDSLM